MTTPEYTKADLAMVAFLATRIPAKVTKERHQATVDEIRTRIYDRDTEQKLRFLRGQITANELAERRTA